jgi:glycolate oxidase FAD binding subunit
VTALEDFAAAVGSEGPVSCAGGRTQWEVGGPLARGTREVVAPSGIVSHEPAEMIVRVRAGTTLGEMSAALARGGQRTSLEADDPARATVGGVLSVGHSGVRRLGWGPLRDSVLEVTAVNARGELIRSGAPLVKNVTGFDLCRLFVGCIGTLAIMGEVVLRCVPLPEVETWWKADDVDPFAVASRLYRPLSVLWDGRSTWVGIEGRRVDVDDQARRVLGSTFRPVEGPPLRPGGTRRSLPPASLRSVPELAGVSGDWLAEVGVGVVHCTRSAAAGFEEPAPPSPAVAGLHASLKERFDPDGRLNPGRSVLPQPAGVHSP